MCWLETSKKPSWLSALEWSLLMRHRVSCRKNSEWSQHWLLTSLSIRHFFWGEGVRWFVGRGESSLFSPLPLRIGWYSGYHIIFFFHFLSMWTAATSANLIVPTMDEWDIWLTKMLRVCFVGCVLEYELKKSHTMCTNKNDVHMICWCVRCCICNAIQLTIYNCC